MGCEAIIMPRVRQIGHRSSRLVLLLLLSTLELSAQPWFKAKQLDPTLPPGRSWLPNNDPLTYAPDSQHPDHTPLRTIRINVHFVNTRSGQHNYDTLRGRQFARELIAAANHDLANNQRVWLPSGHQIPVLPTQYRLLLYSQGGNDTGIYFHYDDECAFYVHKGRDENLFDHRVVDSYAIGKDSIVNLFIMPHHPDSMRSASYRRTANGVGVMLFDAIKMAGIFETGWPAERYKGVLNHELGHFFGLQHAWTYDGCADTPEHDNPCWNWTPEPPCNTQASNNVMDNNANQNAWTPCQIGTIHQRLSNPYGVERRYWLPVAEPQGTIYLTDTVVWPGAKDLNGHLYLKRGAYLSVLSRLTLPSGATITIEPGATLLLGPQAQLLAQGQKPWAGLKRPRRGLSRRGRLLATHPQQISGAQHW